MAENTKTFQELLLEQRNTNKELASLKQENRLMSDVLKDIRHDAEKDSTSQGILRAAIPEIISDTANTRAQTKKQVEEFDQQQKTFGDIAGNIREMVGISTEQLSLTKEINKSNLTADAKQKAEEERATAIKKSKGDDENEKEGNKLTKSLKDGISGIFAGFKGIFLGTAGIFAAIYLFVAALGNETFRNIVFKATDAVTKAFVDFGELIEGDKGLLEFLRENILTLAGIITLLAPAKVFGLLFKSVKGLPETVKTMGKYFSRIASFFRIFTPILGRFFLPLGLIIEATTGAVKAIDSAYEKFKETGNLLDALNLGFSTFVGYLISLPARIFKTLIDGALGLLEFITFGWLNFDTIQQKIRDLDFVGTITDAIYSVITSAQNFVKSIFSWNDPEEGSLINFVDTVLFPVNLAINFVKGLFSWGSDEEGQTEPFKLGEWIAGVANSAIDWVKGLFDWSSDEETTTFSIKDFIFGPDGTITKLIDWIKGLFDFELPNIGDTLGKLNPLNWFGGDKDEPTLSEKIAALDGPTSFKEAGLLDLLDAPEEEVKLQSLDEFLSDKPNKQQYEELMNKMKENGDLTDAEKSYIQQINIMKGGDSVSQSSSTGFSTKKSAYNDDYTMQALAGSMP